MITEKAAVYVVSHDNQLLDALPSQSYLRRVNLNELGLVDELSSNQLAENRFLLTDQLLSDDFPLVGFVSARWNERFPLWPKIDELSPLLGDIATNKNAFCGPQTIMASGPQVKDWIGAQDHVHPGMSSLLLEVLEATHRNNLDDSSVRPITMGNNFILNRDTARSFLNFWREAFSFLHSKYGFALPFSYRCARCGYTNPGGVGRWDATRHAGFLYERVSALYFATSPELVPLKPKGNKIIELKRNLMAYSFRAGPILYRMFFGVRFMFTACTHTHKALGK